MFPYGSNPGAPTGELPALTVALEGVDALWRASDVDGVLAAAQLLLKGLVSGATLRRQPRSSKAGAPDEAFYHVSIGLSEAEEIAITIPKGLVTRPVQLATEAVRVRVQTLVERAEWEASIGALARSERMQRALFTISAQVGAAGVDLTAMLRTLHRTVATLVYARNFHVALYEPNADALRFPYYVDAVDPAPPEPAQLVSMAQMEHSPTWYVIQRGQPLRGSYTELQRQVDGPLLLRGAACVDWLGVPLLRGKDATGCIIVQSYDPAYRYTDQDQELLVYVSTQMGIALERRATHSELTRQVAVQTEALRSANRGLRQLVLERQRGEQLQAALFQIAKLASTTDGIGDFYAAIHRVVGSLLYARNLYVALLSDDGAKLTFPYGVDERGKVPHARKLSRGLIEYVLRRGTPVLADAAEIERLYATGEVVPATAKQTPVCWLGVPLVRAKHTIGVLAVHSYSGEHRYTARDQELLAFVSFHIANALAMVNATESAHQSYNDLEVRVEARTRALAEANRALQNEIRERARVETSLKHQSLHDALTALPNRMLLEQQLREALQRFQRNPAQGFAVLFVDLDRFKIINDSVGHLAGDDLLLQAGRRLRTCVKARDAVARLGGDEFGVLLDGAGDVETACRVAQRIIDAFSAPFSIAARELFTSASVGITLATTRYHSPDELLRDADAAMYHAKAEGRHRWRLFDEGLRQEAVSALHLENDLRRAQGKHEFVPYYQPIVALNDGHIVGYEALARWVNPQRGVLLPEAFLDAADDIGMAEVIDWQILEQVCCDAPALAQAPGTFIAVNLSARHFHSPGLDRRVFDVLATHHVAASSLRIEVTEHAMMQDPAEAMRVLQMLRGAGVGISLDDFGTGYSSLSYLHQYPIQTIKIDRSFIAALGADEKRTDRTIVRTIIAMAHLLSLEVIAEGVETEEQRGHLLHMGCREAQGFLYGQAQPLEAVRAGPPH